MDEIIRNQLNGIVGPNFILLAIVVLIGVAIGLYVESLSSVGNGGFAIFFMISLFVAGILMEISTSTIKNSSYSKEKQIISVAPLPDQIINTDTYSFVVNNKELKALKYDGTKYIRDSKTKPYIVIEKIKYNIKKSILVNSATAQKINNKEVYVLEEIHY